MIKAVAVAVLVLATGAACSSGDDGGLADQVAATTTGPQTPEEAFLAEIESRMTFDGADGAEASLDVARSTCDALDTSSTEAMAADSAASDRPETDAALSGLGTAIALAGVFDGVGDPESAALVLVLGAEHFCPEHRNTIIDFAATRGVDVEQLGL